MCSANCREQIATQKGTLYDTLQCKSIDFVEDHFADAAFKSGSGVTERQASRYSYGFVIVVVSLSPFQKKKKNVLEPGEQRCVSRSITNTVARDTIMIIIGNRP
jgi:hypothetical protein